MTYHYKMCGLDYVFLRSGYRLHETEYGEGVSITRADELDRAIAAEVITSHARLRGQEVRFLRALTGFSQTEVANQLGVKRLTVARWEGAPDTPIPGPADRLMRLLAAKHIFGGQGLDVIMDLLIEITDVRPPELIMSYVPDEGAPEESLFPEDRPPGDGWRPAKAA